MARVAAKVAQSLGMNRFAITKGANDGVAKGNLVDVTQLIDITDPDSNEVLGQAPAIVAQLNIVAVSEKFAVAAPVRDETVFAAGKTSLELAAELQRGDEVSVNAD